MNPHILRLFPRRELQHLVRSFTLRIQKDRACKVRFGMFGKVPATFFVPGDDNLDEALAAVEAELERR